MGLQSFSPPGALNINKIMYGFVIANLAKQQAAWTAHNNTSRTHDLNLKKPGRQQWAARLGAGSKRHGLCRRCSVKYRRSFHHLWR